MPHFDSIDPGKANFPALSFPTMSGVTVPENSYPDEEAANVVIPLRVKNYTLPIEKTSTTTIDTGGILNTDNGQMIGGKALAFAQKDLPRLVVEGDIDTPLISDESPLPSVLVAVNDDTFNITYGELINLYISGDLSVSITNLSERVHPLWFRDPYGRVYNSPRIIDYTGGFVEQVPGRTTFNLTLRV